MSEARSLPLQTIYKYFLQCAICSKPFNDPRTLPCSHAFCCECLENRVKSCNDGENDTVSYPLCKTIYPIPEDRAGMKGFPVDVLVTNVQDIVDKAKHQIKSSSSHCTCRLHKGKEREYFCENCGCAACSDCLSLDLTHEGHSLIGLEEASKQQRHSLENITRSLGNVEKKYKVAMQKTQQIKQDLDGDIDGKIQAIDEARHEHMRKVDELVRAYKKDAYNKKEENALAIEQIQENLRVVLDTVRRSKDLASNVIASGSDSDMISLYPSLLASLQQLAESQPADVDSKLGQIELEPHQRASTDLPSLEQLICDTLHVSVAPPRRDTEIGQATNLLSVSSNQMPSAAAQSSSTPAVPAESNQDHLSSIGKPEPSEGPSYDMFHCRVQPISTKTWKRHGEIKTAPHARRPLGIAVHPNGDIVLTSGSPVTVFSRNGDFKHSIEASPSNILDIAVAPISHQYIIPGENGFYIYDHDDSQGVPVGAIRTYDINNLPSNPNSVAVDSAGRIVIGLGYNGHKTVSIHQPDGTLISKYETTSPPRRITYTPDDKLIISFADNTLQVMDQTGHNASIIQPPPNIQSWEPCYVCCSKQGELFVVNWIHPSAVYRYVCIGDDCKYLDCITEMKYNPRGIALSADDQKLFIVERMSDTIHIFR